MDIYAVANQMKAERLSIFDLNIRVTFYARVSTTRDEQENSIEHQIEFFTDMIQKQPNWTFVNGYIDRVRGENAENRANFMRMIQDGKAGEFDLILTKEVSRFARNTVDSLTYTRDLLRAGVGVFFQNDNICTIDTDSEFRLTIMASMAADEVRKLSERVRWGHKRSIESGKVLGNNRIFGYDKVNCRLVVNENEAEMVRMIFELYSTGDYSTRKIEQLLFERGYRGRNGTRIHHNTISGIIQNPKYKGYYCGNKVKITDYRTKEQRFLPKDEWIMYKDESGETVPALVSEELWEKCNLIFKERSTAIKSKEHSFKDKSIFTGKVWCAVHDKPYWRTSFSNSRLSGNPTYQWICGEKRRFGAKTCASIAIMEHELYSMLGNIYQSLMDNIEDYIRTFMEAYRSTSQSEKRNQDVLALRTRLEREGAKKEKLLELYMDGDISKDEFRLRNEKQTSIIEELEQEIGSISAENDDENEFIRSISEIEKYLRTMYDPTAAMDKKQIDEISRVLLDRVTVTPMDETSMQMDIKLKTGHSEPVFYVRNGRRYGCRSGHISKKMIDAYKMQ